MNTPLSPTWADIAIRLALTLLAGAVIGLSRGARGHAAGFRTTILVCLAASVAMIQANILLPLSGKTSESFADPLDRKFHMMGKNFRHALCYHSPGSGRSVMPLAGVLTHAVQLSLVYQSSS